MQPALLRKLGKLQGFAACCGCRLLYYDMFPTFQRRLHERRMTVRRSDDKNDIHIGLQYLGWIRNQLDARTTSLKVSPGFLAPGAHWPDLRQTAGK
jgi:hypothetical protein